MIRVLRGMAMVLAVPVTLCLTPAVRAQTAVNPNLPMQTKPLGPQHPALLDPGGPVQQRNTTGVITPPPTDPRMPVIHPQTSGRMLVIPPPGTAGGNPTVVPK